MRELLAQMVAAFTGAVALGLALVFAWLQNPAPPVSPPAAAAPPTAPEPAAVAAGRAVYDAQRCAMCHAIAGAGNPRYPLDGVGSRLSVAELHDWIAGGPAAAPRLPGGILRMKQAYQALSEEEMAALVAFMESLRR